MAGGLADDLEIADHGVDNELVGLKGLQREAGGVGPDPINRLDDILETET